MGPCWGSCFAVIFLFGTLICFSCQENPDRGLVSSLEEEKIPDKLSDILRDSITVLSVRIFVVRKSFSENRYATRVNEKELVKVFGSFDRKSINPILLQMGITFVMGRIEIINVELGERWKSLARPWGDFFFGTQGGEKCNLPDNDSYTFLQLDDLGNPIMFRGRRKHVLYHCNEFRILLMRNAHEFDERVGRGSGYTCCGDLKRAIILDDLTSRNRIAHQIGHVLGLVHPSSAEKSCYPELGEHRLMSSAPTAKSVFLERCESLGALRTLVKHRKWRGTGQNYFRKLPWRENSDLVPNLREVAKGWQNMTIYLEEYTSQDYIVPSDPEPRL
ncbi:MAG: hypothetical protein OXB93_02660 [Cytophagales bacterium]|nr:hypothetical protein [Cytophagales bacterium]